MHWISLGFSCQTRFMIDACAASVIRYPFDYVISTKSFVLKAIESGGANFLRTKKNLRVYQLRNGVIGVGFSDVYFWHEYRTPEGVVPGDWENYINAVNDKFASLWIRFSHLSKDEKLKKTFVVSNVQNDLPLYTVSPEDYKEKFGIDEAYCRLLKEIIIASGTKNFSLLFIVRDIGEAAALRTLVQEDPTFFDVKFIGDVKYGASGHIPASALIPLSFDQMGRDISEICGNYTNNAYIERSNWKSALIYVDGVLQGEAHLQICGYVCFFSGGAPPKKAEFLSGILRFDDKVTWFKST